MNCIRFGNLSYNIFGPTLPDVSTNRTNLIFRAYQSSEMEILNKKKKQSYSGIMKSHFRK